MIASFATAFGGYLGGSEIGFGAGKEKDVRLVPLE
jgi:hypothetical protein